MADQMYVMDLDGLDDRRARFKHALPTDPSTSWAEVDFDRVAWERMGRPGTVTVTVAALVSRG